MRKTTDLTGRRFGKLTVVEKTNAREDRYWIWRCKCDCGREILVNTKRLTRGTVFHCGCEERPAAMSDPIPEDLTGKRYGNLTVLRLHRRHENGKTSWLCQCDCGNQCVVTAYSLYYKKRKSCGCRHRKPVAGEAENITGQIFGRLTAVAPTSLTDSNGATIWKCQCACGTQLNVSQDSLIQGCIKSCGCMRRECQESLHNNLTFADKTCIEVLKYRKSRSDNTSGFRGVSRGPDDKWLVTIGLQGKRYYVGLYTSFDRAVKARLRIEEALHDGFIKAYQTWQERAAADGVWAKENPFYFYVEKRNRDFYIDTVFGSTVVQALRNETHGSYI